MVSTKRPIVAPKPPKVGRGRFRGTAGVRVRNRCPSVIGHAGTVGIRQLEYVRWYATEILPPNAVHVTGLPLPIRTGQEYSPKRHVWRLISLDPA